MAYPIRLSNELSKHKVLKTVTVPVEVEIRPEDLASTLSREDVVRLCARHDIQIKANGGRGRRHKIDLGDLDAVEDDLRAGAMPDALIKLERLLPRGFRHLSEDVERFYRGRR